MVIDEREKKWMNPSITPANNTIVATLGPRPGNTAKPPPNNYKVYKWVKGRNFLSSSGYDINVNSTTQAKA